ncbi:hypothetical protein H257_18596 [Aphanomyces astaci]|uniref:Uncharacterized protein n=1 Tax=Aphanomyces astaci TaxID=112090 RepID=W4FCH1_APHAT|nr:hypothetical protein H257_18596 [Aphanomyces astaci]ETV64526.1 hypothetical protein H257_18596 [Aphanomyces astaci]|eukprot:XP_009845991.1 hypothetical protein H257_18596 [Aphanomyces astaci]
MSSSDAQATRRRRAGVAMAMRQTVPPLTRRSASGMISIESRVQYRIDTIPLTSPLELLYLSSSRVSSKNRSFQFLRLNRLPPAPCLNSAPSFTILSWLLVVLVVMLILDERM